MKALIFGLLGAVIGGVLQNVTLPFWTQKIGPYFVLVWASFIFALVFTIIERGIKWSGVTNAINYRKYWLICLLIGVFDALNGFFVVYSSPKERTPPILQTLLANCTVIFTIPMVKWLITEKKKYNYCQWMPIAALVALLAGIGIAVTPDLILLVQGKPFFDGSGGIFYVIIFVIGDAFGAVYNVLQEKFSRDRKRDFMQEANAPEETHLMGEVEYSLKNEAHDFFAVLSLGCTFQFASMLVLFPADAIPHFGTSGTVTEVWPHFANSFLCNLGIAPSLLREGADDCTWFTLLMGVLFILGYITSYLGTLLLNKESSSFAMFGSTLASPLAIIIIKIFPILDSDKAGSVTPYWSVVPAAVLFFAGVTLWKWWEQREEKRLKATLPGTVSESSPLIA